jgi:hypothetical protein
VEKMRSVPWKWRGATLKAVKNVLLLVSLTTIGLCYPVQGASILKTKKEAFSQIKWQMEK